jgi:hypothetical protein
MDKPVQLFLSYTRKDEAAVAQLYERLAASLVNWEQWVLMQIVGKTPPDPTRPALASKYANQPILNAPKSD